MMMLQVCFLLVSACFLATTGDHVADDCHGNIDLALLFDKSASYGAGEMFKKFELFIKLFLQRYNIGPDNTRLAVITFSKEASILFKFDDGEYQSHDASESAIIAALNNIEPTGHPMTEVALMKAHDVLFGTPSSRDKQRVLFAFVHGNTPNPQLYMDLVRSLQIEGVNIVVVSMNEDEAKRITGKRGHPIVYNDIYDALSKLPKMVEATCLIHGGYTEWSQWGVCSQTCGGGKQNRDRTCTNPPPSEHGKDCSDLGSPQDTRPCNTHPCGDIDGGYSEWTEWSTCSQTCGNGSQIRHRLCVNPPQQDDGQSCDVLGPDLQTQQCKMSECKAQKPPCEEGIDLAILIDQSLSVSVRRLKDLLTDFFPPFIDLLHVSLEGTYLSVLRFSRFIHFELIFADRAFRTRAAVKSRITSIDSQTYANTRIDRLLNATFDLLDARHGERKDRQNVLAVFTDGKPRPKDEVHPFHNTIIALREVKKAHIVAVGYGRSPERSNKKINRTVLTAMAGDNVLVMNRRRRGGYASYAQEVYDMVCAVDGGFTQWSVWSLCSASCGSGTQSRSRTCTAPPRREGGKECKGEVSQAQPCGPEYCPRAPPTCKNEVLDLAFVIEASSELGVDHFLYARDITNIITHLLDISPSKVRVSLILFNSFAYKLFSFEQPQDDRALASLLNVLPPVLGPGKRLDSALEYLDNFVFSASTGDRPDARNVAVFFTDGKIQGHPNISQIVSTLKDRKNVDMITLSVGSQVEAEVLYKIAGPKMAMCSSFQEVKTKIEHVMSLICD